MCIKLKRNIWTCKYIIFELFKNELKLYIFCENKFCLSHVYNVILNNNNNFKTTCRMNRKGWKFIVEIELTFLHELLYSDKISVAASEQISEF